MSERNPLVVLMEEKSLNQREFAERLGVDETAVSRWKNHRAQMSVKSQSKVIDTFGLDPTEFYRAYLSWWKAGDNE